MMMMRLLVACLATVVAASVSRAQDTNTPCKSATCILLLDWGSGKTSGSFPPDRRYGSGDDFESRFRAAIGSRGYRFKDGPIEGAMTMSLRPTTKARVMCDAMAGLNPDMNCTAMTGSAVSFTSAEPKVKAPRAIRITNRCAAGDIFMPNREFAQYASDMIWYQLEGQAAKADRPIVNC